MVDNSPWLLVGLGNPGPGYAGHRHNVGFMAVEAFCDQFVPAPVWSERHKGQVASVRFNGIRAVALKPQTFMNRSGQSVAAAARYFRIPPEQIVVVHDELDFPLARLAIKVGGGHGGHNGLRDIISQLGSRDFIRIRFGIGRPVRGEVTPHVLGNFATAEQLQVQDALRTTCDAMGCLLREGVKAAMNQFNTKASRKPSPKPKQ